MNDLKRVVPALSTYMALALAAPPLTLYYVEGLVRCQDRAAQEYYERTRFGGVFSGYYYQKTTATEILLPNENTFEQGTEGDSLETAFDGLKKRSGQPMGHGSVPL